MTRRLLATGIIAACALLLWGDQARGGFRLVDTDGGGGPFLNIIVRQVTAAPIRAHVGDVIKVDMVVENHGDLGNSYATVDLLANGRRVDSKLFNYGFSGEGDRIYQATFLWDTRGTRPGEYRIRGEVFIWGDASPFDNFLDLGQPLVLLAPGGEFPAGETGGGSATSRDPRYRPAAGPEGEEGGVRQGGRTGSY